MINNIMKYTIIEKSWCKRRPPDAPGKRIKNIRIPNYKEELNHLCDMHVEYEDNTTKIFISRVINNNGWIVDGTHVAVRIE